MSCGFVSTLNSEWGELLHDVLFNKHDHSSIELQSVCGTKQTNGHMAYGEESMFDNLTT